MYERVKSSLLWLLKVPPEPHDPMGDVQSLRVFRAAPGYLKYITVGWVISQLGVLAVGAFVFVPLLAAGAAGGQARRPVAVLAFVAAVLALLVFVCQAA